MRSPVSYMAEGFRSIFCLWTYEIYDIFRKKQMAVHTYEKIWLIFKANKAKMWKFAVNSLYTLHAHGWDQPNWWEISWPSGSHESKGRETTKRVGCVLYNLLKLFFIINNSLYKMKWFMRLQIWKPTFSKTHCSREKFESHLAPFFNYLFSMDCNSVFHFLPH